MKKILFLAVLSFLLLGCNQESEKAAESTDVIITINSDDGQTIMTVDETTRNITSATYINAETGIAVNKQYSYKGSNLSSVAVSDPAVGSYTITYEDEQENSTRSLIAEEDVIPKKTKKIRRTFNSTTRAAAMYENSEPDTIEYQYDEEGNLKAIFRIDDKNNVICKGEE